LPAPTKLTAKDKAEILRRRADNEGIQSIANDFGIAHQTVSKVVKQAREAALKSEHESGRGPTEARRRPFVLRGTEQRQNPRPFQFDTWFARDAHYETRRLRSQRGYCISNEVRRGLYTRAEVRRGLIIRHPEPRR
jgi:hypothetical protein